jgi:hypothetical protein
LIARWAYRRAALSRWARRDHRRQGLERPRRQGLGQADHPGHQVRMRIVHGSSIRGWEERQIFPLDPRDEHRAIQVLVPAFAGGLGCEQAHVTCCSVDGGAALTRLVLGAERVGGALGCVAQRGQQMPAQLGRLAQN